MNRFENGFDSFKKAVLQLENRNADEYALKEIVINFHHAVEVLLKHVLSSQSKCLVYKNMDGWIDSIFNQKIGETNRSDNTSDYTISFEETLKRVTVLCDISLDKYTYDGFQSLHSLRNSLTHDEVELKLDNVEQIIVSLLSVVTGILESNLSGQEKEQFEEFINSDKYKKIIRQLIGHNVEWRLITISNLLEMYHKRTYDSLSQSEIRHIVLTLSILGVRMYGEVPFCNIDGDYYLSYLSYLKQEICDLLICHAETTKKDSVKKVIRRTGIIHEIVEEYLRNGLLSVYELLRWEPAESFEDETVIHNILDTESLIINHHIFVLLGCIDRVIDVAVFVSGEKRKKDLREKIFLDAEKKLSAEMFYSALIHWYQNNGWFSEKYMDRLEEDIKAEVESGRIDDAMYDEIYDNELWQDLIGDFGEFGTIDRVDDAAVEGISAIIKKDDSYIVTYDVTFDTQTYCDHEYFHNGSEECYVMVEGHMDHGNFVVDESEFMGKVIGFSAFKFD